MITTITFIGFLGATLLLVAFAMSEIRWRNHSTLTYGLLNMFGAMLLLAYAIFISDIPFGIVNAAWTVLSIRDVALYIEKRRGTRDDARNKKNDQNKQ